jgi:hypothetical protein
MMVVMARKKGQTRTANGKQAHGVHTPSGFAWLTKKEFNKELHRRIDEIESGKVKTIPLDVALREIRERLQRRRGGR